ncbi:MAG: hypothetical protein ACFCBW_01050 [Candidatus Competibacterales bacterium]
MDALSGLLAPYGLEVHTVEPGAPIPGSYWGDREAGLVASGLWVRPDTPLHSALHEACHFICMDEARRHGLHTDAGGDDSEECAVCYLQILLADGLEGVGRQRLMADMDEWGYSFRLGSTARWLAEDALDARRWLIHFGLIDPAGNPTGRRR